MESQSVSAQLYFKQLTNETGNAESDASIENAFQKQLDLSEFYKSKNVFETMKKDYMDKTMEGSVTPELEVPIAKATPPVLTPTPANIQVGPRDFLNKRIKSTFGESSSKSNNMFIYIIILLAIGGFFLFNKH